VGILGRAKTGLTIEKKRQAAIFLDRDGTINEEAGYLDRMEKLRLIPGAAEAIRLINASGMKAVVVTNQSGIARGFFTESILAEIHARLGEMLRAEGASLDGIYFCPHHPTEGRGDYLRACACRKPEPGLLLRATAELGLDPDRSYMVGDTLKDIEAGTRAGAQGVLVRTGYGAEAAAELGPDGEPRKKGNRMPHRLPIEKTGAQRKTGIVRPVHIAGDLLAGVQWILRNRKP
jgi:D,D-heptose 1,7-bisphosphate phosphatase